MINFLDIRTLSFTSVLLCLVFGVILIIYAFKHPRFQGIKLIGSAFICNSAGFFLLGFINVIDVFASVILANTFFLLGLIMACEGLIRFNQINIGFGKYLAFLHLLFMLPSFLYFTYIQNSLKGLIVTISICYVIECLRCSYVLFMRNTLSSVLSKFVPATFFVFALLFFYRILFTLNEQEFSNFTEAGLVHALTFITIQAMVLITSISVFWSASNILENELLNMARIDPLTSAFNRRALDELATVEITRSIRKEHELSILMCDIDHFKNVNDQYGHQAGDKTLTDFSHILKSNVRAHDIVSRYGGEEFLILLPETDLEQAALIAEKLRRKIEEYLVIIDADTSFAITASFGVACYEKGMDSWEKISLNADNALYQAKGSGRNCVIRHHS